MASLPGSLSPRAFEFHMTIPLGVLNALVNGAIWVVRANAS